MNQMIMVVKECTFDAAHHLPWYDGDCKRKHGHTYRLQIGVRSIPDKDSGMVVDFKKLKECLDALLSHLDHYDLNDVTYNRFPCHQTTAERIILWIRDQLMLTFPELCLVRLWETPNSFAEWNSYNSNQTSGV